MYTLVISGFSVNTCVLVLSMYFSLLLFRARSCPARSTDCSPAIVHVPTYVQSPSGSLLVRCIASTARVDIFPRPLVEVPVMLSDLAPALAIACQVLDIDPWLL